MAGRGSFGSMSNAGGGYSSYTAAGGSNEFNRLYQSISTNVQKIKQNVSQMKKLAADVGTPRDSPDLRERLHQVQHYTNQVAKDSGKMMKDLSLIPAPPVQSEQKQRKIQKDRLTNEFTEALKEFQSEQREVSVKERASLQRAKEHSSHTYDPFKNGEQPHQDPFSEPSAPQQQVIQMENDVDLDLLREREQAIRQLESDIMDVNHIFSDLGTLVHEQGGIVDSIETHVEDTYTHVQSGTEQLSKAREYQSKARRKKCIIIVIIIVVLAVLGLIIGLSVKS